MSSTELIRVMGERGFLVAFHRDDGMWHCTAMGQPGTYHAVALSVQGALSEVYRQAKPNRQVTVTSNCPATKG